VAAAVVARWRQGQVRGLQFDEMTFEEAGSLGRPAMSSVRGQLRARVTGRLQRAYRRWLQAAGGRRPGDRFL
jgi:hypothetical protein